MKAAHRTIARLRIMVRMDGHVAEWLRSGLQNRLPRFNSGRGLHSFKSTTYVKIQKENLSRKFSLEILPFLADSRSWAASSPL